MASAGMGDVLSGISQPYSRKGQRKPRDAAVYLHGAAADALVAEGIGPVGLTAGEVIDAARKVF